MLGEQAVDEGAQLADLTAQLREDPTSQAAVRVMRIEPAESSRLH